MSPYLHIPQELITAVQFASKADGVRLRIEFEFDAEGCVISVKDGDGVTVQSNVGALSGEGRGLEEAGRDLAPRLEEWMNS